MNATLSSQTSTARRTTLLRGTLFLTHILVVSLAVASIVTFRFHGWIDLRLLGPAGILLELAWAASTILVPFLAGPWPGGRLGAPRWVQHGLMPAWALYLLWPTYLLLICLTINQVNYWKLWWHGDADLMFSGAAAAWILLALWTLLTREWIRRRDRLPATAVAGRWLHLRSATAFTLILSLLITAMSLRNYSRPPAGPVDLAVVLGCGTRTDGTPSTELEARVRVAIDLYQRGLARHIMLSGAVIEPAKPGKRTENEIASMLLVCQQAGIPDDAITLDPVGVNTRATAFNARKLMREKGWTTVVACSSDFHLYRIRMCFNDYGIAAYALPAVPGQWPCDDLRSSFRELIALAVYEFNPRYREPKGALMQLAHPRIIVHKSQGLLELFDDAALVKKYACITGGNDGDKEREDDRKTPLGAFRIVYKNPQSKYHLSLGLDYPNREDADRGLRTGLITREQYDGILGALKSDLSREENQKKLWYTPLGGEIFIHGFGTGRTGTAGCVALSNADIEELYAILPIGTPVEIRE
jgi:uncharacterized SAM-binding protein YcdF (DUF218 family)